MDAKCSSNLSPFAVIATSTLRPSVGEFLRSASPALTTELRVLRQVACRLQAVVRQRTRLLNQLHQLLALAYPELALLTKKLSAGWVLELMHRYPTAALLPQADEAQLAAIAYLPQKHIPTLLQQARSSIASLSDDTTAELVRDQVRQLRDVFARQKRLEKLLVVYVMSYCQTGCCAVGLGAFIVTVLSR